MQFELFIRREAIRSQIYRLLAYCFYPPDKSLFRAVKDLDKKLGQVGLQTRLNLNRCGNKRLKADSIKELEVECARLFVGPYSLLAPPYGSVYLEPERRMMGNSTMDVIKRYQQSGLAMAEDFKDAPDHIAAELEFMHFLIYKEIEAANQGDARRIHTYLLNQRSFLADHLGAWVSEFVGKVLENANTTFYQNLARATDTFIKDDYLTISSLLNSGAYAFKEFDELKSFPNQP